MLSLGGILKHVLRDVWRDRRDRVDATRTIYILGTGPLRGRFPAPKVVPLGVDWVDMWTVYIMGTEPWRGRFPATKVFPLGVDWVDMLRVVPCGSVLRQVAQPPSP